MPLRQPTRIALHFLLAVSLVIPGIVAPAQAVADGIETIATASTAHAAGMQETPCDDMETMPASTDKDAPCDCCAPHACDFSACLGTACLPGLARVAAIVPPVATPLPWQQPNLPLGVIDTPLRPPIA